MFEPQSNHLPFYCNVIHECTNKVKDIFSPYTGWYDVQIEPKYMILGPYITP